jgi:hypothetical protein
VSVQLCVSVGTWCTIEEGLRRGLGMSPVGSLTVSCLATAVRPRLTQVSRQAGCFLHAACFAQALV